MQACISSTGVAINGNAYCATQLAIPCSLVWSSVSSSSSVLDELRSFLGFLGKTTTGYIIKRLQNSRRGIVIMRFLQNTPSPRAIRDHGIKTLSYSCKLIDALQEIFNRVSRVRIVKLLTQHVARGDCLVSTNDSTPCWW